MSQNREVPEEQQDTCKYCGSKRTQRHLSVNNEKLRCPTQGCPGQHV